jgi:hypothetical protein
MVSVGLRMTATVPVAWELRLVFGEPWACAEGARRNAMRQAEGPGSERIPTDGYAKSAPASSYQPTG